MVHLGSRKVDYIPGVSSYKLSENGQTDWVAYLKKAGTGILIAVNLKSGRRYVYADIMDYEFNKNGDRLLIETKIDSKRCALRWVNLATAQSIMMGEASRIETYKVDVSGTQVVYVADSGAVGKERRSLFYYKEGMSEAVELMSDDLFRGEGCTLEETEISFSKNGDKVLFSASPGASNSLNRKEVKNGVTVWSYRDAVLPSRQWYYDVVFSNIPIWSVISLKNGRLVRLTEPGEVLYQQQGFEDYFLVGPQHFNPAYVDKPELSTVFLVSAADGERRLVTHRLMYSNATMSSDERFVLWYNSDSLCYIDYDIGSGITRNLGLGVPVSLYSPEALAMGRRAYNYPIAGWSCGDRSVYLYDDYDIWKLDLGGRYAPINITRGYGRRNKIAFGIVGNQDIKADRMMLTVFNEHSKDNGIILLQGTLDTADMKKRMQPWLVFIARTGYSGIEEFAPGFLPMEARKRRRYLVWRQTASEFPNLYATDDFIVYKLLSMIHPENDVNWLRAELIAYPKSDGTMAQGILYKPENFDSTKKYPVIFECYEKMSDNLHDFLYPDWSHGRINIPYYVSNGYLVFTPDINWRQAQHGAGILDATGSAVKQLRQYTWVDSTRLGMQGHSFGGWVADFLATHSHWFAAVCAVAGEADEISAYDELVSDGRSFQGDFESGQAPYGHGVTPWNHLQIYIDNSPIFETEHTQTPLLLAHGDADSNVPYQQSLELFLSLRAAGKQVWLLQYKKAGHILANKDAQDFTIRMKQFFDYYLKGEPAPSWMTVGAPAVTTYDTQVNMYQMEKRH